MADTQTITGATSTLAVPSGDEIYDALMSEINMDLLTVNLPHLEEQNQGESPEERTARFKRYQQAFEKYDLAFAAWIASLHGAVEKCKRDALKMAEADDRTGDIDQMNQIENAFAETK